MKIVRTELSKDNEYYISKHNYLELKHFCMQYPEWKQAVNNISWLPDMPEIKVDGSINVDAVSRLAEKREDFLRRIELVERVVMETDYSLFDYILIGVTSDISYINLRKIYEIPCCRNEYYKLYHKFFWLLSKYR